MSCLEHQMLPAPALSAEKSLGLLRLRNTSFEHLNITEARSILVKGVIMPDPSSHTYWQDVKKPIQSVARFDKAWAHVRFGQAFLCARCLQLFSGHWRRIPTDNRVDVPTDADYPRMLHGSRTPYLPIWQRSDSGEGVYELFRHFALKELKLSAETCFFCHIVYDSLEYSRKVRHDESSTPFTKTRKAVPIPEDLQIIIEPRPDHTMGQLVGGTRLPHQWEMGGEIRIKIS